MTAKSSDLKRPMLLKRECMKGESVNESKNGWKQVKVNLEGVSQTTQQDFTDFLYTALCLIFVKHSHAVRIASVQARHLFYELFAVFKSNAAIRSTEAVPNSFAGKSFGWSLSTTVDGQPNSVDQIVLSARTKGAVVQAICIVL